MTNPARLAVVIRLSSLALLAVLCGCQKDLATQSLEVSVDPAVVSVPAGSPQQFVASINGTHSTAVTWSVASGGAGGTINATGVYFAPATFTAPGTDLVVATSTVDTSRGATAHVTLTAAAPVVTSVAVAPNTATIFSGKTQQFAALVNGAASTAVTWSVAAGGAGGTVDSAGLYTAPALAGSDSVVATSTVDATKSGAAAVTVLLSAPSALAYSPAALVCVRGTACGLGAPAHAGGAIASFAISPALPAGLALDAATGAIAGTPTATSPQLNYTVSGLNAGGIASAVITVRVNEIAPADLTYSPAELSCTVGVACLLPAPGATGGPIASFAIDPALPAGLVFNIDTGAIGGAATAVSARTLHTVTATNSGGTASVALYVTVNDVAPKTLAYDPDALTCYEGVACLLAAPTSTGGAITAFDIAPALPAGLSLDATGAIGGVPTITHAAASYTVTASNSGGRATAKVTVQVLLPLATSAINGGLAAGFNHSCARVGGGVYCWGDNSAGELGNSVADLSLSPVPVQQLGGAADALVAGFNYTCAIVDGAVDCWGSNQFGNLGNNSTVNSTAPVAVVGLANGVQAIAGGKDHVCAISNGAVFCWGSNNEGQLGNNSNQDSAVPVAVVGLSSGVQAIAAGDRHTCALVDGSARCWGDNGNGQLGVPTGNVSASPVPVQVQGLTNGVQALALGAYHSCAIVGGGLSCWGYNEEGELGIGSHGNNSTSPVAVTGLSEGVQAVAGGEFHTCAVVDGAVKCWGYNVFGQLGNNSTDDSDSPVASGLTGSVQGIALGLYHGCALVNGGVQCWGSNADGELGDGTQDDNALPTQTQQLIDGVQASAPGLDFSCALLNGGVQCFGANQGGQLGNNTLVNSLAAVDVTGLGPGQGVQQLVAGAHHACAIVNGGAVCWGSGSNGQLGSGMPLDHSAVPVQVSGLTHGVQALALGAVHGCALVGGGVQCWGGNASGQLGDNSTIDSAAPVQVSGLASGVQAIAVGATHSCAVLTDGTARCWGDNGHGQLGDGAAAGSLVPVTVSNLSDAHAIAAGDAHSCALSDGAVYCWGAALQLGDGAASDSDVPSAVPSLGSGVRALAASAEDTCALSASGLVCWGAGALGQLGDNSILDSGTPVQVSGLASGVLSIAPAAASHHFCALAGGSIDCWGANESGQLGLGVTSSASSTPQAVSVLLHLPAH